MDLPNDIIFYILSFTKFNNQPHIIYVKKDSDFYKLFYKGSWENNKFEGYGRMYCKKTNYCNLITEEPYNINVLKTFYKLYLH